MSTPLSEKVLQNFEAVLNDAYPKTSLSGDFITAENTVDGMTGTVVADEETDIVVCNKNFADNAFIGYAIGGDTGSYLWEKSGCLTQIIKCLPNTCYAISKKRGDRFVIATYFEYPSAETDVNVLYREVDIEEVKKTIITPEDAEYLLIYVRTTSGTASSSDIQLQVELVESEDETSTDYIEHQEQNYTGTSIDIKTYDDITHIYNTSDVNMTAEVRERRN